MLEAQVGHVRCKPTWDPDALSVSMAPAWNRGFARTGPKELKRRCCSCLRWRHSIQGTRQSFVAVHWQQWGLLSPAALPGGSRRLAVTGHTGPSGVASDVFLRLSPSRHLWRLRRQRFVPRRTKTHQAPGLAISTLLVAAWTSFGPQPWAAPPARAPSTSVAGRCPRRPTPDLPLRSTAPVNWHKASMQRSFGSGLTNPPVDMTVGP